MLAVAMVARCRGAAAQAFDLLPGMVELARMPASSLPVLLGMPLFPTAASS